MTSPSTTPIQVDAEGFATCPDCQQRLKCGPGGVENLEKRHRGTKVCREAQQKLAKAGSKNMSILSFLKKKPAPIPSQVSAPAPIQGTTFYAPNISDIEDIPPPLEAISPQSPQTGILQRLRAAEGRLPASVPLGTRTDALAAFAIDPAQLVEPTMEADSLWEEVLNGMLKSVLGWADQPVHGLVRRGEFGLSGLLRFVEYFVSKRGVSAGLFEGKLSVLMSEIDDIIQTLTGQNNGVPPPVPVATALTMVPFERLPCASTPIDVDAIVDVNTVICPGYVVCLQPSQSPSLMYPFGLHDKLTLPWDYSVVNGTFTVRSRVCHTSIPAGDHICRPCRDLERNENLKGIVHRANHGVHENANYAYHGIGGLIELLQRKNAQIEALRLRGLNQAKCLIGQAASLSDHKRFVVAIGSGKYEQVDRLVRVALKQKRGIRGIINLYHSAAMGLYNPKSYTEQDDMRGLLLWKLGGNRVAQIAHRALGLPGVSTLRTQSTMPPIIPSHGRPTTIEIEKNIKACFESMKEVLDNRKVVHHVLMLDEIATEKRLRWDHLTNYFLGVCREHGEKVSLEFNSELDQEELFRALAAGDVHYAAEATVGALGLLTKDTRLYAACPILISGDCKRETGAEHAAFINTILKAIENKKSTTHLRLVSIASDGETRRGSALVDLTFKRELPCTSNIYPLLSPLPFMNFHVGEDDITADKDWKHVFKRFRNLLLRDRGVVVNGFRITPSIIRTHLQASGLSSTHINALFNPDDKQNVKMAFDLLKDIWSLPPATTQESTKPGFSRAREALRTLGKLLHHIVFPYLCVDLSLSEQLEHLSAAAHLLLVLYTEGGKEFIPTLLFVDLMIMIKNAFFCVAKAKVDDPDGYFWIILLGTDRLEELFGILRTMVGNDANLDVLQLVCRLTGTTEVSNILAKYPHWDRPPRRLNLPALTRESQELPEKSDHIKPASWRGDVAVKPITLLTSWNRGRRLVEEECTFTSEILRNLDTKPGIDILSPFGVLLINMTLESDDNEDDDNNIFPAVETEAITPPTESTRMVLSPEIEDAFADEGLIEDDELQSDRERDSTGNNELPNSTCNSGLQRRTFDNVVSFQGKIMSKSRALALRSKYTKMTSSTDRLKRVQEIERFANISSHLHDILQHDSAFGGPCLLLQEPITSLIRCEDKLFLCLGEVNGIKIDGAIVEHVGLDILLEDTVTVSYQVIGVIPASNDDDPNLVYDWRSTTISERTLSVPGRLVKPVNPTVSTSIPGRPFYLFESKVLLALTADLFEGLAAKDLKVVPKVAPSRDLPYREASGKACFVCESDDNLAELEDITLSTCPNCSPPVSLPTSHPQRILSHIGSHILHDPNINRANEPCGLCLRPSPKCIFYLIKGKGAKASMKINETRTKGCSNAISFAYGVAAESSTTSPCSNVPIQCPLCPRSEPAVWRYNLKYHFLATHPKAEMSKYDVLWKLSNFEIAEMKKIWVARQKVSVKRKKKTTHPALVISEAHSSRMALSVPMTTLGTDDQSGEDLESEVNEEEAGEILQTTVDTNLHNNVQMFDGGYTSDDFYIDGSDVPGPSNTNEPLQENNEATTGSSTGLMDDTPPSPCETIVAPDLEDRGIGRSRRKRKARDVGNLSQCLCGLTLSQAEVADSIDAIQCKRTGCETGWYHLACVGLELVPRSWTCEVCSSSGVARAGKRRAGGMIT